MRHLASLCVLALLLLPGCAGDGAGPPRTPQRFLSIGTAPPGGAFFIVGAAIGEVLAQEGAAGWEVTAEATKGSQENIRRLVRGEIEFALSNSAISYFAVRGEGGWDRHYPVRAVMTLAPNVALFITPAASGLSTLADLRGRRVLVGPAGAGFEFFLRPLLEAHGLAFDDFTALYNTQSGAVDMLADRSAAAAFLGGAVPTASITQACATQDIHFVPYDPEAVAMLASRYLFFNPAVIPGGTYRGHDEDFQGLDVGSMHLITSSATDADLVYDVTRTLYEHRKLVTQKHPAGRAINPRNVGRDTGTEFHPGAVRYYEEIGIWPRRDDRAGASSR